MRKNDRPLLVFDESKEGHRGRGLSNWTTLFGAESVTGLNQASFEMLRDWDGPVLLQTIDYYGSFAVKVAMARTLLGRGSTAGTLHRPSHTTAIPVRQLKRIAFRTFGAAAHGVSLISTVPKIQGNIIAERGFWIYDPEWWDLPGEIQRDTVLSLEILQDMSAAAKGRAIILFTGGLTTQKGFIHFANCARACTSDNLCFVAIGKNSDIPEAILSDFQDLGGLLIDRFVSDEELFAAVRRAEAVWCCYAPDYDISSGIFGRALQLGSQPIVRMGSWLARAAEHLDVGFPIPYGNPDVARSMLLEELNDRRRGRAVGIVNTLRGHSLSVLQNVLGRSPVREIV